MIAFGPYTFDSANGLLRRDAIEVPLPPRVLGVLAHLLARPGQVVARQELIDAVWKEAFVTDTSLAEAVSSLRQALGDDPQQPVYIQTLHRRGYRFVAPLLEAGAPGRPRSAVGLDPGSGRSAAIAVLPVSDARPSEQDTTAPSITWQLAPWSLLAIVTAIMAAAIWKLEYADPRPAPALVRFSIPLPPGSSLGVAAPVLAVARDGSRIAWTACAAGRCGLWTQRLDALDPQLLPGTATARAPFFSPDGGSIGFFADGKLKRIAVDGGAPVALADAVEPFGASWGDNGRIVFAATRFGGLSVVSEDGGPTQRLTRPAAADGEIAHLWPFHGIGTRDVIFTVGTSLAGGSGRAALLTLDDAHGAEPGGSWRTLLDDAVAARVAAPGLLAFRRKTELFGVAWDDRFQALAGTPVPLQSGVGDFATSASGALIAAAAPSRSDRAPAARLLPGDGLLRQSVRAPADSRDAGVIVDGARADVWIVDAARGAVTRVTHDGTSAAPAWSPDGRMLAYASRAGGAFNLYARAADGSGDPRRLTTSARHQWPASFTPDGAALAFTEINTDGNADLWLLRLDGQAAARPILTTRFSEIAPAVSPDGRWLAYESDESGRWEVYVQPWQRSGPRSAVSTAGGGAPRWSPDSRRLFYDTPAGPMVVSIAGGGPAIGAPEPAAPGESATERMDPRLVITLEWAREARTRVPPGVSRMTR